VRRLIQRGMLDLDAENVRRAAAIF